jgi:hypothetical protein
MLYTERIDVHHHIASPRQALFLTLRCSWSPSCSATGRRRSLTKRAKLSSGISRKSKSCCRPDS